MEKIINVGKLRQFLDEEAENEFKPVVFGNKETKEINRKAYSDIKKETDKYDGGLTKEKNTVGKGIGLDDNKGMSDLTYDNINKPFKERVKSQMKGYFSKENEKLHKDDAKGNVEFDDDEKLYKKFKDHAEAVKKGKDTASEIGLTGRELPKKDIEALDDTMFESKKIKKLTFKNMQFISEGHMLSKIPDEYKKDGNKFIMRDSHSNEYIVEWSGSNPKVTKKVNEMLVNEQKERIKQLWGYKSSESNRLTPSFKIQEDKCFGDMVNKARNLMK